MDPFSVSRHRRPWRFAGGWALALGSVLVPHVSAADTQNSQLWGTAGQRWDRAGRLTDFSYAGYHRGECPLPERSPAATVKDFGAVGDGTTDDTAAFERAVQQAGGRTILIPAGRHVLTDIIELRAAHTVLRGAGPQQTVI